MGWLKYSDDEVNVFHPEFQNIGNRVLHNLKIEEDYHWEHHLNTSGSKVIPDFVLIDTKTNTWCLVVEIKRSKSAVFSTRHQIQAKGYADENSSLYRPKWPLYFAISNMETSLLFAQNGSNPPKYCRIKDMTFNSGNFLINNATKHKQKFEEHLAIVVSYCLSTNSPVFESYWPRLTKSLIDRTKPIVYDPIISYNSTVNEDEVSKYFAGEYSELDKIQLLLRCLLTEFLQGILKKYNHPKVKRLSANKGTLNELIKSITILKSIDFSGIFELDISKFYQATNKVKSINLALEEYIQELISQNVDRNAETREDSLELPDLLVEELYPLEIQEKKGKVQTDPDLAYLLSSIAIEYGGSAEMILDPGCGDGSLLSAAYDVLKENGVSHLKAIQSIMGIEIDPVAAKIAALRLALKEPYSISEKETCPTLCLDMFTAKKHFLEAQIIIMNPPFKRYEDQDSSPIPQSIRSYYSSIIEKEFGKVETNIGQVNIFHYYLEYIIKASNIDTIIGVVLDNKWYHNKYGEVLREFILRTCSILSVVEYPHDAYFKNWSIATSLLFLKVGKPEKSHDVSFIRCRNPFRNDFKIVSKAMANKQEFPSNWSANKHLQSSLGKTSWKENFSNALENEFRNHDWPILDDLFKFSRRGSLAKEGGGIAVFEFPFKRTNYGPSRTKKPAPRSKYQTVKGDKLSKEANVKLKELASNIPDINRGLAIQNADQIDGYIISTESASKDQTLESPMMRSPSLSKLFFNKRRVAWSADLDNALKELSTEPHTKKYISSISKLVGLNDKTLTKQEIWNVLREPYAGELIIPRKIRIGHRIHINEFAYDQNKRQLRLSSNFFSYSDCIAIDNKNGLDRIMAVELISAFLMSSFGQLQFEIESFNREGARSIEQHQLNKIRIFDPRWIAKSDRDKILSIFRRLPYPLPTDIPPYLQEDLIALDSLFAKQIITKIPDLDADELIEEVQQTLFEWIEIRKP